nr:hypothetical protein [Stenotrophomonas pavanii]
MPLPLVWLSRPVRVLALDNALSAVDFAALAVLVVVAKFWLVAYSCLPLTASVLEVLSAPSATPEMRRLPLALLRTSSTLPLLAAPRRTLPLLLVWLSRPLRVLALDSALSAVDFAALAVLVVAANVWLVAYSCLPVTASLLDVPSVASATFTIFRLSELLPTEIWLDADVVEFAPRATEPVLDAFAPCPTAIPCLAVLRLSLPIARLPSPDACENRPMESAPTALALLPMPMAMASYSARLSPPSATAPV